MNGICKVCGVQFKKKAHNQLFCCSECKRIGIKQSNTLLCVVCNREFKSKSKTTKVCCKKCKSKLYTLNRILKEGSFADHYPELVKYWNYDKNNCSPSDITRRTANKYHFICEEGHEFQKSIDSIGDGGWCPYCCNQKVLTGFNDFLTHNPEKAKYWDYNKNKTTPDKVAKRTGKKYYFICEKGHSFKASPDNLANRGCPHCSNNGKIVKAGINDFESNNPDKVIYWDYSKNDVLPSEIFKSDVKKYYFICEKGHSFKCSAIHVSMGHWCHYCSGHKTLAGFNDFESNNPEKAKYWDYNRNTEKPSDVHMGTHKKYYFVCEKGHSFQSSLDKIKMGRWCPECANEQKESKLATYTKGLCKELFNDVETETPTRIVVDGVERILKPDILINDIMVHIEVHGEQHYKKSRSTNWFKTEEEFVDLQKRDKAKKEHFEKLGYKYIEIRVTTDFAKDKIKVENIVNKLLMSVK